MTTTTQMPSKIEEDLVTAVSMLTRALGACDRVRKSNLLPGGPDGDASETMEFACDHLRMALGFGDSEKTGLMDLIGMRVFEGWLEKAKKDGTYADLNVYRYDTEEFVSLYSVRELIDKETGFSFWHLSLDNLRAHMVAELRVPDRLPYVVTTEP